MRTPIVQTLGMPLQYIGLVRKRRRIIALSKKGKPPPTIARLLRAEGVHAKVYHSSVFVVVENPYDMNNDGL